MAPAQMTGSLGERVPVIDQQAQPEDILDAEELVE